MKEIKLVGLVLKPGLREEGQEMIDAINILTEKEIDYVIEGKSGYVEKIRENKIQAIITLGGDGTLLGAIKRNLIYDIPVLGIHLGKLGFLTEADFGEFESVIESLAKGNYLIKERMMLEIETEDGLTVSAINELVVRGKKATSFVGLKLFVGGKYVNSYVGDGLIVATPTGSTAYNLSAGGPILYPFCENYILTPIASHSLTQRSLVLPVTTELEIRFENTGMVAIIDGQEEVDLEGREKLIIRQRRVGVKVICRDEFDFFRALKNKLRWGDD